jgi:hypothetical protein
LSALTGGVRVASCKGRRSRRPGAKRSPIGDPARHARGNRSLGEDKNRRKPVLFEVPLYQFIAAEIRALHCSYGIGDEESYKRALTFLENCERYTLRSLVRRSAKHHAEVTVDHAKRIFLRALKKLETSQGHNPTLRAMIVHLLKQESSQTNSQPSGNT